MGSTTRQQVLQIAVLALASATFCHAQQPATTAVAPAGAATDSAAETPAPVVPPEAPVLPPKVVCNGDQMTIAANNSTLSSVLNEVHRCMGTRIDLPEGAGEKRMFDHIGPGPAAQVIDELLSATGYNYIIGSSPANEEKIDSIMLLARATTDAAANAVSDGRPMTNSRRAFLQMHQASIPHPMTDADIAAAAATAAGTDTAAPAQTQDAPQADSPTGPAPAATDAQPAQPADAAPAPTDAAPSPSSAPATTTPPVTTPPPASTGSTQDQITNMQQMFELRKRLNQQNQNPPQ